MQEKKKQLPFGIIDFIQKTDFQSDILLADLEEYLEQERFPFEKNTNKFHLSVKNFYTINGRHIDDPDNPGSKKEVLYLVLHNEGFKTSLDYIQLEEARAFSKESLCRSTIAIVIAVLFGIGSILININIASKPTIIDLSQKTKSFYKELSTEQLN